AEFMANEVPGVHVPEGLLRRMAQADEKSRAAEEGVAIAREMAAAIRPRVQGLQLGNASGRLTQVLQVFDALT
ncbi:MAG TPA: hypothetical protein VK911_13755, partial [Vicinamibacterales bacterium]|nr:hypothetical protein [Vicinamibacterales bacterium]